MRLRRHPVPFVLIGLVSLAATACSGGGAAPKPAAAVSPETVKSEGTVTTGGGPLAPLTGVVDASGASASRPSIAVKIDNAPEARPQSGLDVADVVYEEVVEGGVTRFIAVFQSTAPGGPGLAGPVRSVRPMDPNVLAAYKGLIAYSGGIPAFRALLHKAPVQDVDVDIATDAYTWDNSRAAPHNEYVSPDKLWPKAKGSNADPPPAMFQFRAAGEPFGDADAHHVVIPFSPRQTSIYDWDAASGSWKRTSNGTPHLTAAGTQIAPQNVVVQFVPMHTLDYVDPSGTKVVESTVTGSGDAWILSNGRITKGHWSKSSAGTPTQFTDSAGNAVKLTAGRTWVHLAPVGTPVSAQ